MNDRTKALQALAAERWRISLILSGAMIFIYFGFILLIAFNKPLLGSLVFPGLSLGILLGALVIVSAWVLIFIYVRWANSSYDDQIARLTRKGLPNKKISQN
ncbi:MAG: DUF485 domain-containing protein [Nostoc sp.]|uniref:DUF485 domain-containing protein n=2 Tax=Nostoc sp. TaxID=1180 RepID=UPI002FFADB03